MNITMLAGVAERVRAEFAPASWLIVDQGVLIGLCSITRPLEAGVIDIGYGVAPGHQGRGVAIAAVAEIVAWARMAPKVKGITAETAVSNGPSQWVLVNCGFVRVRTRHDPEDGELICWRHDLL